MKELMKPKNEYLHRANSATTVLALLALLSAVPGGIRLYRFAMDAQDQNIEVANLLGVGDRSIPGLGIQINEPYVTLTILILAVLLPLLVFLLLLGKKSALKKDKVAGTGLYWLIVLAGLFGLLLGLGLVGKILSGDLTNMAAVRSDTEHLFIAGVSALSVVVAFVAINILGKGAIAPDVPVDYDDEDLDIQVVDRATEPSSVTAQPLVTEPQPLVTEAQLTSRTFVAEPAAGFTGSQPHEPDRDQPHTMEEALDETHVALPRADDYIEPQAGTVTAEDPHTMEESLDETTVALPEVDPYVEHHATNVSPEGSAETRQPELIKDEPHSMEEALDETTVALPRNDAYIEPQAAVTPSEDPHSMEEALEETTVAMAGVDPYVEHHAAAEEPRPQPVSTARQAEAAAILERDLGIRPPVSPAADEAGFEDHEEPSEEDDRPTGPILVPAARPGKPAQEPATPPREREIKRRLVSFPGDDTKVIVILREYNHGRFVREWSEIRLKSDFTHSRRSKR